MEVTVKDRLIQFINTLGISVNKFEGLAGLSVGYMRQLRKEPSPSKIKSIILAFPQLNQEWLLTGEGQMLKSENETARIFGKPKKAIVDDLPKVRFFEVTPKATFQEFCAGMDECADTLSVIPAPDEVFDDSYCVFEISGESMAPQIRDRARVLCKEISPTKWHKITDGVVVIAYADKFVIKRILSNDLDRKNCLTLGSDNPEYPAEEKVSLSDIRAIFLAVRIISSQIL